MYVFDTLKDAFANAMYGDENAMYGNRQNAKCLDFLIVDKLSFPFGSSALLVLPCERLSICCDLKLKRFLQIVSRCIFVKNRRLDVRLSDKIRSQRQTFRIYAAKDCSEPIKTDAAACTKGSAARSSGHYQNRAKPLSLHASVTIRTLINSISSSFTTMMFSRVTSLRSNGFRPVFPFCTGREKRTVPVKRDLVNDRFSALDQKNMIRWVHWAAFQQLGLFHIRVRLIAGGRHA